MSQNGKIIKLVPKTSLPMDIELWKNTMYMLPFEDICSLIYVNILLYGVGLYCETLHFTQIVLYTKKREMPLDILLEKIVKNSIKNIIIFPDRLKNNSFITEKLDFSKLTKLNSVKCYDKVLSGSLVKKIVNNEKIEEIDIESIYMDAESVFSLLKMANLKYLSINTFGIKCEYEDIEKYCCEISLLTKLEINCSDNEILDILLKIKNIENIEQIIFNYSQIYNTSLQKIISKLKKLTVLELTYSDITSDAASSILLNIYL